MKTTGPERSVDPGTAVAAMLETLRRAVPAVEMPQVKIAWRVGPVAHDERAPFGQRLFAGSCRLERRVEPDGSETIDAVVHPGEAAHRLAARFAVQPALLRAGWLLLHALSVRLSDGVHVFAAPSGTGKTTLARRFEAAGAAVLGDEVAIVGHERVEVFPFQSMVGRRAGPLAAVHLLERGAPGQRRVRPSEATRRILSQVLNYEDGREAAERTLELVSGLVVSTRVFETQVPDDDRALVPFASLLPEGVS